MLNYFRDKASSVSIDPIRSNLFEVILPSITNISDAVDIAGYKIERDLLYIDVNTNQQVISKNISTLQNIKDITIKLHDISGNVYLVFEFEDLEYSGFNFFGRNNALNANMRSHYIAGSMFFSAGII